MITGSANTVGVAINHLEIVPRCVLDGDRHVVEQSYRLEECSNAVSYELSVFPEDLRRQARPVSGFVTSTAWP